MSIVKACKILDSQSREEALQVIRAVYLREKNWIHMPEKEIPLIPDLNSAQSWFLATVSGIPAGVIRLTYDPSLCFPAEMGVTLRQGVNLDEIAAHCRLVEIGRFMIMPQFRKNIRVALRLMNIAIREVVEKGYTHFLTDVFEADPLSPLHFHTKILGFEVIGSHLHGELNCSSTRIILTLDILKSYQRLKERKDKTYQEVTAGIQDLLDRKLAERPEPLTR